MKLKLLALTFLIMTLAVTPVFAQPAYWVHTDKNIWIRSSRYYHFGGGIYVRIFGADMKITALMQNATDRTWFNFTVGSTCLIYYYTSLATLKEVWMNGVNYTTFVTFDPIDWSYSLGTWIGTIESGATFPANVSLGYEIPVAPEELQITLEIVCFDYNTTLPIGAGSVNVTDPYGNSTLIYLPATFSLLKGVTYTFTFYGDGSYNYYDALGLGNPWSFTFTTDTTLSTYWIAIETNLLPVPIIFIFGMVGLGCMFVGPTYMIKKVMDKEYRHGLVWGVILTALGFALFIAWLFGGVF